MIRGCKSPYLGNLLRPILKCWPVFKVLVYGLRANVYPALLKTFKSINDTFQTNGDRRDVMCWLADLIWKEFPTLQSLNLKAKENKTKCWQEKN